MKFATPTVKHIRGADRGYLAYHAPRYRFVLGVVSRYLSMTTARVLEIGPSPLLPLLEATFGCQVDSLGLEPPGYRPEGRHYHFDLNRCCDVAEWPELPRYALVILAEVIEHLHTSPVHTLSFVRSLLDESGVLLLQTPNAASLPKRLKLLAGRNPYELIRPEAGNPGHFREYTLGELQGFTQETGFRVVEMARRFYFDARFAGHGEPGYRPRPVPGTVKNVLFRLLPGFLREGLTLVLRKDG